MTTPLELFVDGRRVVVADGATLLDAVRSAGLHVPTLCHDDRLRPVGACRICLVHVEGTAEPVAACSTPAQPGMAVNTAGFEGTRRAILAMMAARYPRDAVAASPDEPFHKLLLEYSVEAHGGGDTTLRDESHPYIDVDMSRCITCLRCVRICEEVEGADVWRVLGRGEMMHVAVGTGPTLKDSTCTSCGACASTCPSGAIVDRTLVQIGAPTKTTRTTCPYCGVGCELDVGTRNGTITQILPTLKSAVNRGHLCVKGRYSFGFVRAPDRLLRPLIRERIDDDFHEASWREAIEFSALRLRAIINVHGRDAVGVLASARATNEENYVAQKFARIAVGTNNIDCCARVCHAPTAAAMGAMFGTGAATNSYDDIESARAILLCGSNATENHPVVGARIRQAARRGAQLIVIDPRRTELAAEADVHLQLRPGTNVLLLNALAHVILDEALVDEQFLAERVSTSTHSAPTSRATRRATWPSAVECRERTSSARPAFTQATNPRSRFTGSG